MKVVFDKNLYQSSEICRYLSADLNNIVVIPEISLVESFNNDDIAYWVKDFYYIARHPRQFVILLSNDKIIQSMGAIINDELIDYKLTEEYRNVFISIINGEFDLCEKNYYANAEIAKERLGEMKDRAESFNLAFSQIYESIRPCIEGKDGNGLPNFTKTGLETLHELTNQLSNEFISEIKVMDPDLLDHKINIGYINRYSVSIMMKMVSRIHYGVTCGYNQKEACNDLIDCVYISQSTYFDGFITKDRNTKMTHDLLIKAKYIG